jgi:hypothetical protein
MTSSEEAGYNSWTMSPGVKSNLKHSFFFSFLVKKNPQKLLGNEGIVPGKGPMQSAHGSSRADRARSQDFTKVTAAVYQVRLPVQRSWEVRGSSAHYSS